MLALRALRASFVVTGAVAALMLTGCPGESAGEGEGEGEGEEGEGEEGEGEGEAGEGEGEACGNVPDAYVSDDFAVNAAEALALRAQLDTLTGATAMRGAEQATVVVDDVADLTALFEAGEPSLSDVASPGVTALVDDAFEEFVELIAAGPQNLVNAGGQFAPGAAGGIFGVDARGINEGGLEVRQIVDKALFAGGGHYAYALSLTEGEITEATIDAIAAAWGNNATLDETGELADSANYTFAMGYHDEAKAALIAARTHATNAECAAARDEALVAFFRVWERAMFARFSHYANIAAVAMTTAVDADGYAGAMHELAEGAGLAVGFHGLPHPAAGPLAGAGRIVSDADIETMMGAIGLDIDDLGASTTGTLLIEQNFAAPVADVEAVLATALDADAAEVERWREPTSD